MLPNLEIAVLHESIDWARIKGHTVALISFESIMRIKTFVIQDFPLTRLEWLCGKVRLANGNAVA